MDSYLGGIRHRVPVTTSQTEVAVAYPVQDFIWSVFRSVGKWSETDEHKSRQMVRLMKRIMRENKVQRMSSSVATYPASMVYSKTPRLQMSHPSS